MKFGIVLFGILSATVAPSMAQAANTNFSLYCPGESKLFIGADGSFIRPDKDTYLSWSREKQESYQSALSLQILRTDASTRAYESVTNYFRANPLEIHRKVEDALNKDERLVPFRQGDFDLLRKPENQMTKEELQAYLSVLEDIQNNITDSLAQKNFNAEFCAKR
jgi:hypothetical protein